MQNYDILPSQSSDIFIDIHAFRKISSLEQIKSLLPKVRSDQPMIRFDFLMNNLTNNNCQI
ncbi:MAG TPA: hypothetical protein DCQ58_05940 [Saprospirales bacterium]|nr:hypothetical protein [Saprospirales bacterium]